MVDWELPEILSSYKGRNAHANVHVDDIMGDDMKYNWCEVETVVQQYCTNYVQLTIWQYIFS